MKFDRIPLKMIKLYDVYKRNTTDSNTQKKKVKEWENIYQYNVNSMQNSWSGYSYIKQTFGQTSLLDTRKAIS